VRHQDHGRQYRDIGTGQRRRGKERDQRGGGRVGVHDEGRDPDDSHLPGQADERHDRGEQVAEQVDQVQLDRHLHRDHHRNHDLQKVPVERHGFVRQLAQDAGWRGHVEDSLLARHNSLARAEYAVYYCYYWK
jgi:hypothetical protein